MWKEARSGFLISRIAKLSARRFERILADEGVDAFNGAQGRILYVLWQEDYLPVRALSQRTSLAKNTLTSMLDRMEAAGLIVRCPDEDDRRVIRIRLSEKARALREKYDAVSLRMNEIYFDGFSDGEIDVFEGFLVRIMNNLEEGYLHG